MIAIDPVTRVLSRVVRTDAGCWEFTGSTGTHGYARINVLVADGIYRTRNAHRVVYEQMRGPVPDGLVLDHLCRNRACVNPWHLEAVTNWENLLRGESLSATNSRKSHCPAGHAYDEDNTLVKHRKKTGAAYRACRACNRDRRRRQKGRDVA